MESLLRFVRFCIIVFVVGRVRIVFEFVVGIEDLGLGAFYFFFMWKVGLWGESWDSEC